MSEIENRLLDWQNSLPRSVDVRDLYSANPIVYKWKAPFRIIILRELVFWRLCDVLVQSQFLYKNNFVLGAKILLRSGFETLSVLMYVNHLVACVLNGSVDFHDFDEKTVNLLLGSRNGSTEFSSINILTTIEKSNNNFPGLKEIYADLSESSHPNYEGICLGYSKIEIEDFVTTFENRWADLYGRQYPDALSICMQTFEHEYNEVWPQKMEQLASWILANDVKLEQTKRS